MIENNPRISIITPTYNRVNLLEETIDSVLSQNYKNIEYIVIDDGSTDNTIELLKKYSKYLNWYTQSNMGETRTVNRGFELTKGDYVCVLNSDDPLLPNAISTAADFINKNSNLIVAYPNWVKINFQSKIIEHVDLPEFDYLYMVRQHHCIVGPGAFIKKSIIDKLGGRDSSFKYVADFDFWLRAGLYGNFGRIPDYLATFRIHPNSASQAHNGKFMANEHIHLMRKYFSNPNLPKNILEIKKEAFSWAHFVAAEFSGSNKWLARWHLYNWFLCNPDNYKLDWAKDKFKKIFFGNYQP